MSDKKYGANLMTLVQAINDTPDPERTSRAFERMLSLLPKDLLARVRAGEDCAAEWMPIALQVCQEV